MALTKDPTSQIAFYGPLVVLALLLVCVAYSAYALAK